MIASLLIPLSQFCLLVLFSIPHLAQTIQTQDESAARIKKTIRLVEVDVIAKDKKGRPVTGLTVSDFILKDNGHPETIAVFSAHSVSQSAPQNTSAGLTQPNFAHTFSNIRPADSAPVVILMDLLNTPFDNQLAMKTAVAASLRASASQTPVALLTLADNLTLISDFTNDPASLANLLDKPSAARQEGLGPAITAPKTSNVRFNDVILKAAVRAFNDESSGRITRTMTALGLIRNQLARMNGRKSLIWIGGGIATAPADWPAVRDAIDKFNDANVAIYTIDARGVLLGAGAGADSDATDMLQSWSADQTETRGDLLEVMSRSTGGVLYHNTNALAAAITRAVEDDSSSYMLGYYPRAGEWQVLHKIDIRVARSGVALRYRTAYFTSPEPVLGPATQQEMLQAAAGSPLDFPGVRFSVELQPARKIGQKKPDTDEENNHKPNEAKSKDMKLFPDNPISLTVHVAPAELQLSDQDGKSTGSLQFWLIQKQPTGDDITRKTSAFGFQLTPAQLESAQSQGISFTFGLNLKPATSRIRVLLRDLNSGRIGTVDASIEGLTENQQ